MIAPRGLADPPGSGSGRPSAAWPADFGDVYAARIQVPGACAWLHVPCLCEQGPCPSLSSMPRETLTREQIVRAAIELLDREGIEGLNMRSLGKRLDSAATAVYWHVKNKDDLVRLASDEVWNEMPLPELATADWRTAATRMATGLYAMLARHPWLVAAFTSQPLYGENKARHDDHSLAVYEKAGFTGAEADQAAGAVFTYVLGHAVSLSAAVSVDRRLTRGGQNAQAVVREAMTRSLQIARGFPRLAARVEAYAEAGHTAAPEQSFEFGLRALLDGFQDRLQDRLQDRGQDGLQDRGLSQPAAPAADGFDTSHR